MSETIIENINTSSINDETSDVPLFGGARSSGKSAKFKSSSRWRKAKLLGIGLAALFLIAVGGVWLMFGGQTKLKVPVAIRPSATTSSATGRSVNDDAEAAIAEARRMAMGAGTPSTTPPGNSVFQKQSGGMVTPATGMTVSEKPSTDGSQSPSGYANDLNAAIGSKPGVQSSGQQQSQPEKSQARFSSQANAEKSIFFDSNTSSSPNHGQPNNSSTIPVRRVSTSVIARAPVVPTFGSILPVRALGAIYTLRTGGLIRLEVTRQVEGPSWELDKGTVLVGTLRGSESDRAFISLVGFIDPTTERFVKLGGNVLGTDGGDGLKGKRRKIGSGWSRALGQAGSSALGLAQSFASRGTTIVLPNLSESYPTTFLDTSRPKEFVEVAAGTQGYVMVTDLPREIRGMDTLESMSRDEIARASDSAIPSSETGLSETEMAELLTSGSPEQIHAALPKMTPAMRQIAETVLSEGDR